MRTGTILSVTFVLFTMISNTSAGQSDDPFAWLEEVENAEALAWAEKHNEKTFAALKSHPAFDEIHNRLLEIYNDTRRIPYVSIRGNYVYNFWQDARHERGIWRRTTLEEYRKDEPNWQVLLDIDSLSEKEGEKWVYKGTSCLYPEYRRCLVSLSRGGADASEVREFDVETRSFVENGFFVPEAKSVATWKDETSVYVGTDFGSGSLTTSGYPRIVKTWKRGTPMGTATTLLEGDSTDVGVFAYVVNRPERAYHIVLRMVSFYDFVSYAVENGKLVKIDLPSDAQPEFFKKQMLVHLKSDWDVAGHRYPQGALITIDYDRFLAGDREFEILIAPDERSSILQTAETKDLLLVNKLSNVVSELYAYEFADGKWSFRRVNTPPYGEISIVATDDDTDRFLYTFESYTDPTTLYLAEDGTSTVLKRLPAYFDAEGLVVHQNEATSKDGTRIPYFVVHRRDGKLDGSNPTLLYGYGGFEVSLTPGYSAGVGAAWLQRGGVYVVANIRGGGEFGPRWHRAGLKENRQRVYDDFYAVAEDLIRRGITSPEHLGILGGSNGGLLTGVAFTQRPDLFGAVVSMVPLLDMQRYHKLLAGASWMAEYGNPDNPEEWAYISKYSPYHNVEEAADYPRVFFATSTRDDRVHPGHARKMVAKMESLGHDVLYYENTEGGHAAASTNQQRAFMDALMYSYLLQELE